jgi:hypothetical protein
MPLRHRASSCKQTPPKLALLSSRIRKMPTRCQGRRIILLMPAMRRDQCAASLHHGPLRPLDGGFKVVDANGQSLAYVYGHADPRDAQIAKALTRDEARRMLRQISYRCGS